MSDVQEVRVTVTEVQEIVTEPVERQEVMVPGTPGPQGATGAAGPQGTAGAAGTPGPQGATGATGSTGPQGDAGSAGAAGPQGSPGAAGAAGPQGAPGSDGAVGPQGAAGSVGPQGAAGPQGDAGAAGPQGATGSTGSTGPQGSPGATGSTGPQGSPGATGPQGNPGIGAGMNTYVSGWMILPQGISGAGAAGTHVSGECYFVPIDITQDITIDRLICDVSTAQSGGTSPSITLAVYGAKANGMPDCGDLIVSATVTVTSTGLNLTTISSTPLPAGRYWLACFYYAPSAPTTAPRLFSINAGVLGISRATSVRFNTNIRGYDIAGLTALPSTTLADSAFTGSGTLDIPIVALRIA